MNDARTDARRAILTKALRMAPFDGWSQETLESAIMTSEVDPVLAKDAFPGGIKQLLAFFMMEADRSMVAEATARGLDQGPVRKQISGIIRLRLTQLRPHREAIRRAVALHLLPGRAPNAVASLWRTVDAIWYVAGDDSTNFNHYTKRALLAAVYCATLLRWLDDASEDCMETWDFMERRIAGTLRIQKMKARAQKTARRLPTPLSVLTQLRYGHCATLAKK